ncbi:cytoskeletal protein binding protein [Ceratobasidium sp. 423]|nr:cytoskeletal protein binding protein [Ceratobasidium sp. 423]
MATSYISVMTAPYGFTPDQGDDDGALAVKRGQMLLLLDASNPEWWKFKTKTNRQQNDGNSGIVPKMLTQEAKFISAAAACKGFIAQADGDLTIAQNDDLSVYCIEGDWALVKGAHAAGYVPRACIKLEEEMNQVVALFDFQATEPEHLGFREGENMTVLDRTSKDWWRCENANHEIGVVPVNLVKLVPGSTTADDDTSPTLPKSVITSRLDASEVVSLLALHGALDLSSAINHVTFGEHPVAHGGFSDVYRGQLSDGAIVAAKVLRDPFDNSDRGKHLKRYFGDELE